MSNTLIWLLLPGIWLSYMILRLSAQKGHRGYDLNEYMLAGKRVGNIQFLLASTSISLLGVMVLPHMGLFVRSGFSYGFMALGTIIIPLVSALFARRLWILGRIYTPFTPGELLGLYYHSEPLRILAALTACLVALPLLTMSLDLGSGLVEGILANVSAPTDGIHSAATRVVTLCLMTALLYIHTAHGGMGAIVKFAAPTGIALIIALLLATLVAANALGGLSALLSLPHLLQGDALLAPLFETTAFFDPLPARAPANMAWPGTMITSGLLALAGLAIAPAVLVTGFMAAKARSHASAQFLGSALVTGLLFLSLLILIALLAHLRPATATPEPQTFLAQLLNLSYGHPLVTIFLTLSIISVMFAASAAAVFAAGSMISNDVLYPRRKNAARPFRRQNMTRLAIAGLLFIAFLVSLSKPADSLPLFLLSGAFGLQLLPALIGLCYAPKLTARAVQDGLMAGLAFVTITSIIPQNLLAALGLTLPFGAWPLSLHPAIWGLGANIAVLFLTTIIERSVSEGSFRQKQFLHQRSFHVPPDGEQIMPHQAGFWKFISLFLTSAFLATIFLPLTQTPTSGTIARPLAAFVELANIVVVCGSRPCLCRRLQATTGFRPARRDGRLP